MQSEKVKNGDSLKEPEVPATDAGQTFDGWYTAAEDGKKFTSFNTPLIVTATTPINLYARFKAAYHIYFYTADGKTLKFTKDVDSRGPHNFSDLSYNVGENIKVTGWAKTLGGKEDVSDKIVIPEGQTSVSVYAIETTGYWVVFDTQGGTSVAPVFQAANEALDLTTIVPTRTGYTFDGWYDNKECTGDKVTTVSAAAKLYAKWTAGTANLTVVFWYENANDDGYGLAGTVQRPENTGATVTSSQYKDTPFDGRDYTHFTYNTAKAEDVTVKGDGSTVLNVYYTRNTYTLTFKNGKAELSCREVEHKHSDSCCKYGGTSLIHWGHDRYCCNLGLPTHTHNSSCYKYSDLTITAKYQADIHSNFPIKEGNDTIWWTVPRGCQSFVPGNYLGSIDTMPGENITFTKHASENGAKIYYYVETLNGAAGDTTHNGKNYKQYKVIDLEYSSRTNLTYAEEFHPITGFTQGDSNPELPAGGEVPMKENNYLYYTRNSYDLKFYNHNAFVTGGGKVQYEAPLSDYDFVPDYPTVLEENIYEFKGWYTTSDCYEGSEADLTKMTMPANDVTLYAKWVPKEFTVSFKLGYGDGAPAAPEQKVAAKGKAKPPADPTREGWRFMGWYVGNEPFSFETEIVGDTTLTAKWFSENTFRVVYNANNKGTGTAPTDDTLYADGAGAVVKGKTADMTPPEGKEFFLGWATIPKPDATTEKYLPGETMIIDANNAVNGVITLYAVWGDKPATTTLTYNANFGENPATVQHKENNSADLLNNTKVTLYDADQAGFNSPGPGYVLDGWATDKDATVPKYEPGDKVTVDTKDQATANILYAVWKQSTTTVTVKKVVEGAMGDRTKAFEFEYRLGDTGDWTSVQVGGLKHGDEADISNVPLGSTLYIREKAEANYTVAAGSSVQDKNITVMDDTEHGYKIITVQNVANAETITVTNSNTLTPDTGVILDSLPYVLILAVVALGAAGVVIRRRRSREDD